MTQLGTGLDYCVESFVKVNVLPSEGMTCVRDYVLAENKTSPLHPSFLPRSYSFISSDTPSQRVQFILGTEEDAEHVSHELFTELDEICVKDGKDAEWKETARSGSLRWEKLKTEPVIKRLTAGLAERDLYMYSWLLHLQLRESFIAQGEKMSYTKTAVLSKGAEFQICMLMSSLQAPLK